MSVSLNATLQTAQDGSDHAPRCRIVSSSFAGDIPFTGILFNDDATDETDPAMIATSTGRMAAVYVKGNDLYYVYTDTDRTTWAHTLLYNGDDSGHPVTDCCLIELGNGNIGVVFICKESTTYLYYTIIDQTGTVLTAATLIESWSSSYTIDGPALCEISAGFMLLYKHKLSTTYSIYRRTCGSAFTTWGADAAISASGLSSTYEQNHCTLLAAASGRIYLFLDYVDAVDGDNQRRNVYYSYSTDDGSTWAAATQLTAYSDYTASGVHPAVAEKSGGDIIIVYHEDVSVLTIDTSSTGFVHSATIWIQKWFCLALYYTASNDKLWYFGGYTYIGDKPLNNVCVIDVSTWTIDKCYVPQGSPGFNDMFSSDQFTWPGQCHAADNYGVFSAGGAAWAHHVLIDHSTETTREYHFADWATYSIIQNVASYTWSVACAGSRPRLDPDNNRLYIFRVGTQSYGFDTSWECGYFELDETVDPITGYSFHYLCHVVKTNRGNDDIFANVFPDENKLIVATTGNSWGTGQIWVYQISSGAQVKHYNNETNSGIWYYGVRSTPIILDNKIYAPIGYTSSYGQEDRRGLMIIDMDTDAVTYKRPTYASTDNYALQGARLIEGNTKIAFAAARSGGYGGTVVYDIAAETWEIYNQANVPGYLDGYYLDDYTTHVAYSDTDNQFFAASSYYLDGQEKVISFKSGGSLYLGKYIAGTVNGDHYDFAAAATLHNEYGGHDLAMAYDENDSLWNIWPTYDGSEYSLLWAQAEFSPDLAAYVAAGTPVEITWEVSKPATAAFSLSRGDLFDPTNSASTYSVLCAKGRKITISFGEAVSGTTYWQQQGEFIVTGAQITYGRGEHPIITVACEDRSGAWDQLIVTATEGFWSDTVATVFDSVLQNHAGLSAAEYSVPTLSNSHALYIQWVDDSLKDILGDIFNHFGLFGHWDTDGVYALREIDLGASTDHDYTGDSASPIFEYTPDDSSSSLINRVIVKCESQDTIEVLWDEQRIETLNGTVGFWSKEDTITAYYSKDQTRKCRNPRIDVIQSINDYSAFIKMLGGNGDEYISDEDPDETWCEITIEAPNRGLYVFGFAAAVVGFGASAIGCESRFSCGVYILLTNLALGALIQSLAAANYRYDLWARPVGHEKEMYQATANDTDMQNTMGGLIISHEFEDPLSNTVAQCQMVADHEMDVVQGQRRRVRFVKSAHLQDEIGDIIEVLHPVSSESVKCFVVKLKRTFVRPSIENPGGGRFDDSIEAWRII